MIVYIPFVMVVVGIVIFLYWTEKERAGALAAIHYYYNTASIYRELIDDPAISSEKWKALLPLFEDADRRFAETHPYVKDFFHYAEAVRREIDDFPCQEVGSS